MLHCGGTSKFQQYVGSCQIKTSNKNNSDNNNNNNNNNNDNNIFY